ncbi:hypothetical protein OF83DRAFT_1178701, partial [Amylostereum chailletii]
LEATIRECDDHRQNVQGLQAELDEAKATKDSLDRDVKRNREEVVTINANHEEHVKSVESKLEAAVHDRDEHKKTADALRDQLNVTKASEDALRQDVERHAKHLTTVGIAHAQEVKTIRDQLELAICERDNHKENVEDLRVELETMTASVDFLNRDVKHHEGEIDYKEQIMNISNELEVIVRDRDAHKKTADVLRDQLNATKASEEGLRQDVERYAEQVKTVRSELMTAVRDCDHHREAAKTLREQLATTNTLREQNIKQQERKIVALMDQKKQDDEKIRGELRAAILDRDEHKRKLDELRTDLETTEASKDGLEHDLKQQDGRIRSLTDQYEDQVGVLQNQRNVKQQEGSVADMKFQYEQHIRDLRTQLDVAKRARKMHMESVEILQTELDGVKASKNSLELDVKQQEERITDMSVQHQLQVDQVQNQLRDALHNRDEHMESITRLQPELEAVKTSKDPLNRDIEQQDEGFALTNSQYEQHIQNLTSQLEAAISDRNAYKESFEVHRGKLDRIKYSNKLLQQQVEQIQSQLEDAARNGDRHMELVEVLQRDLDAAKASKDDLQRDIEQQLNDFKARNSQYEQEVVDMRSQLNDVIYDHDKHKQHAETLRAELDAITSSKDGLQQEVDYVRSQFKDTVHNRDKHMESINTVRSELDVAKASIDFFKRDVEQRNKDFEIRKSQYEQEIVNLRSQLEDSVHDRDRHEQNVEALRLDLTTVKTLREQEAELHKTEITARVVQYAEQVAKVKSELDRYQRIKKPGVEKGIDATSHTSDLELDAISRDLNALQQRNVALKAELETMTFKKEHLELDLQQRSEALEETAQRVIQAEDSNDSLRETVQQVEGLRDELAKVKCRHDDISKDYDAALQLNESLQTKLSKREAMLKQETENATLLLAHTNAALSDLRRQLYTQYPLETLDVIMEEDQSPPSRSETVDVPAMLTPQRTLFTHPGHFVFRIYHA